MIEILKKKRGRITEKEIECRWKFCETNLSWQIIYEIKLNLMKMHMKSFKI